MTIVIDASAMVELLVRSPAAPAVEEALRSHDAVAPELFDVEVLSALARIERRGLLDTGAAAKAVLALPRAPIARIAHRRLTAGAWRRRHQLSLYDALYAALAAELGCALLTADRRLAAAPGLDVTVTLVSSGH